MQEINNEIAEEEGGIGDLIAIVVDGKLLIFAITLLFFTIGLAKSFYDAPIYKADAMLQVQTKSGSLQALDPVDFFMDTGGSSLAEIEIAQSRRVLQGTIDALKLDIFILPQYLPLIGEVLARKAVMNDRESNITPPLLNFPGYAWGGEEVEFEYFKVSDGLREKKFTLIAEEGGNFSLYRDSAKVLGGKIGAAYSFKLDNDRNEINILISSIKARPGTRFVVKKKSVSNSLKELKESLTVIEKVKGTGVLIFSLEAKHPELAKQILHEIIRNYVAQNVEQKTKEAENTLAFLDRQLPLVKSQLEAASASLNDFKASKGTLDLTAETQNLLAAIVQNKTDILMLQEKKEELRARFTENYPSVMALDKQIARVMSLLLENENKVKLLPELQQNVLRLTRDVEVYTALYTALLNNAQTLKVAKSAEVGNVTIVDEPILPEFPVRPNKVVITLLSTLLGLIFGVATELIRKIIISGLINPAEIEKKLGKPVYAIIPHSQAQDRLKKRNLDESQAILATTNKEDSAIESLRGLRATLQFALLDAHCKVIMITSAAALEGKSFIALNLAVVLADSGKKILLIDADLRKGDLHRQLGVENTRGLTELISGECDIDESVSKIAWANIDFIPTGALPPNPAELLLHERFDQLLQLLSSRYDYVVIDTPPVLKVSDAQIIERRTGAVLLVVKAGQASASQLEQYKKHFARTEFYFKGIVVNDLKKTSAAYGDGYVEYKYRFNYNKTRDLQQNK